MIEPDSSVSGCLSGTGVGLARRDARLLPLPASTSGDLVSGSEVLPLVSRADGDRDEGIGDGSLPEYTLSGCWGEGV